MKKLGLYLGTFDPPHKGHQEVVHLAEKEVDEVIVIPAWQNPWKKEPMFSFEEREEMCYCNFDVTVNNIEKVIKPLYSWQTIQFFKDHMEGELWLIGGYDMVESLKSWNSWETRIKPIISGIIEVGRGGNLHTGDYEGVPTKHLMNDNNISSTTIRETWNDKLLDPEVLFIVNRIRGINKDTLLVFGSPQDPKKEVEFFDEARYIIFSGVINTDLINEALKHNIGFRIINDKDLEEEIMKTVKGDEGIKKIRYYGELLEKEIPGVALYRGDEPYDPNLKPVY